MGKRLLQQRRGRSPRFANRGLHAIAPAKHRPLEQNDTHKVIDILHSRYHSAPLAQLKSSQKKISYCVASEGLRVGDSIKYGEEGKSCVLSLADIPEGSSIHNIEVQPGDGGKLVRASGATARVLMKTDAGVVIRLPSKRRKTFNPNCRAAMGVVAGGGRKEKPMLKAGVAKFAKKAKYKQYPIVSGTSMNAVAHPFGSKGSHTKGRPTQSSRNAPPGRKVGKIAPSRTGRTKR